MADKISLLITDDHALVRQGIRAFLELQPDLTVIGEADSGEAAVRMAAELAPDVVLMDLVMPGIGGVEATRQVKQRRANRCCIHASPRAWYRNCVVQGEIRRTSLPI